MRKNKKVKTSSIKGTLLKMLAGAAVGMVLGGFFGFFHYAQSQGMGKGIAGQWIASIQHIIFPGLIVIAILSIVLQEVYYARLKNVCMKITEADDEEFDKLDYEEERLGAVLQEINVLSQVLSIVLLSFGYSFEYFTGMLALGSCLVFIIFFFYAGIMQARYVKLLQRVHPEKRGDVASMNFQQQWLESCDEAEKEVIYQSAYKAYIFISKSISILLVLTMVAHLLFHTGILAIVVVGIVYLMLTLVFGKSCVDLKKKKL